MLDSASSGLEAPDKVERLPKKPKGKTNSKEKLNHEAAYPTALTLCQTDKPLLFTSAVWDCALGDDSRRIIDVFGIFPPASLEGKFETPNDSAFSCRIIRPTSR
jgi:hypothetical protein